MCGVFCLMEDPRDPNPLPGTPHLNSEWEKVTFWFDLQSILDLLVRNQLHLCMQIFFLIKASFCKPLRTGGIPVVVPTFRTEASVPFQRAVDFQPSRLSFRPARRDHRRWASGGQRLLRPSGQNCRELLRGERDEVVQNR